jgi:phage tail-like protein
MTQLQRITAVPHPGGNRIDLSWVNPEPERYPYVRVVRREGTYPSSPEPPLREYGVVAADSFRFNLALSFEAELDNRVLSTALRAIFSANKITLSDGAAVTVEPPSRKWRISDGAARYSVWRRAATLAVYDENLSSFKDVGLRGETVYYYTLFPYGGDPPEYPPEYRIDRHNRAAAMATSPYDMAGIMYALTPAIYHRYDTALPTTVPECMDPADAQRGQLRRFLELPGGQLDQLYSYARALLDLLDVDRVDGRLLPLLAQWIGWETDHRLEYDSQRNEIRNAPSVYQRVGIIPVVEATVKRMLGWESRTKEFVYNVFVSNQPERLNLWATKRLASGDWMEPIRPLSLDYTFEGRPAVIRDADGRLWLFYHTQRNGHWDIWTKTLTTFILDPAVQADLTGGYVTNRLQNAFANARLTLAETATIESDTDNWQITDLDNGLTYEVRVESAQPSAQLVVYRWSPSLPLTKRTDLIDKHPTACLLGDSLWLFWDAYDPQMGKSQLHYRTKARNADWSPIQPLSFARGADADAYRREPTAVVDRLGQIWLFWLERNSRGWQLKYNRNRQDGTVLVSSTPLSFPLEGDGNDPRVDADPFVLFQPAGDSTPERLWLFWARRVPIPDRSPQTRWEIAYRIATGLDPAAFTWIHSWSPQHLDHRTVDFTTTPIDTSYRTWYVNRPLEWGPVQTLSPPDDHDEREPAALLDANGDVELFWSSNRDRSWSIWHSTFNPNADSWSPPAQITGTLYSQRAPLPYDSPTAGTQLLYRANESVAYQSGVYRATRTVDFRYAGATTVDSRNTAKNRLRGQFRDFQTYTFDTGRDGQGGDQNWYARGAVGIYLTPTSEDPEAITRNRQVIQNVLRQFLPLQVRPVLIIEPTPYPEPVYTYEFPEETPQRLLGENVFDSLLPETFGGVSDSYQDIVPGWTLAHSWSSAFPGHHTVDFRSSPIDTQYRTWYTGLRST